MKLDKSIGEHFASVITELEILKSALEHDMERHQSAFDAKSERWQESDKGQAEQEKLDTLQELIDEVENACDALDGAASTLAELHS